MFLSPNNQKSTDILTSFYSWLENQTSFKPFKNILSTVQSNNKEKPASHLPAFLEFMDFCNCQERI